MSAWRLLIYLRRCGARVVSVCLWKWCGAVQVTWIEKNSSGNGEVHTVVLFDQSRDVLPGALPDGDIAFHIIGTVLQQASQGRCVCTVGTVAERVGCCSQRVKNGHATTSVSASRRLFARGRHAGVQLHDDRIRRWPCWPATVAHWEAVPP